MPRLVPFLVLSAALLAACDRAPTAPAAADAEAVAAAAAVLDALLAPRGDPGPLAPGGSLAALFNRALEKLAKEQGAEAAKKLAAPVRELLAQAERAARAGDQATAAARLAAARTESIKIIVRVLGRDAVSGFVADQTRRANELRAKVEAAGKAGQDVAAARALLARLDAGLETASARLAAGDLAGALDAASAAADLFPALLRALQPAKPPVTPPASATPGWSLSALFSQAITTISHDRGEAAAREIRQKLAQLQQEAGAARKAGDTAGAEKKLAEARSLMLNTVVAALGKPAVEAALKAVDAGLTELRARITAAAAAGKNVERAREAAEKAAALAGQSKDKLARGELVPALDLACQAGEWITEGRARLERAK